MQSASYKDKAFATPGESYSSQFGGPHQLGAGQAALDAFKEYARERPEVVTMWAFGLGFVLGWKLRIW